MYFLNMLQEHLWGTTGRPLMQNKTTTPTPKPTNQPTNQQQPTTNNNNNININKNKNKNKQNQQQQTANNQQTLTPWCVPQLVPPNTCSHLTQDAKALRQQRAMELGLGSSARRGSGAEEGGEGRSGFSTAGRRRSLNTLDVESKLDVVSNTCLVEDNRLPFEAMFHVTMFVGGRISGSSPSIFGTHLERRQEVQNFLSQAKMHTRSYKYHYQQYVCTMHVPLCMYHYHSTINS